MNSNKNMKIYLIFTLVVMFFCCPQIYAYYSKNDSKSVTIGTKDLIITGSTSATTYAADSNGVVSIPVTIKNNSGFAVNYNLTLSNTNLKFNDGKTVYSGTIAANTTSTVTLKIVEVNPLGTENTDIDMAVIGPYTKTIDIGSYVLTYDLTPPSCSFSTSSTVLTGNTTTVSVTCTDASGVKTTSLATSAISLKSSLGTLSNPTVTSVTNGYKYSFTYTAGSKAGTETFTLIAGKVSDNVNNTNAATTGTITVQRQVKGTFNINGASSFTYNGTKYTSTTTLTLCTLSSETTCSVTMPTITASTNTPTVIGWSTASGTHTATYTSGQTVSISNNVTLYAQTTKAEITRKVTFGCNGGSGTVASTSCTIGATYNGTAQGTSCTVTLPTSGCTYSGWNFQGWNTSDTATTGVTGSVSISSNKTYYAIWKKNAITYTLSFNTNLINNAGICSASATAPATQSCQIAAVYNGTTQATSCTVTIPTLFDYQTGEWDFNGWGTSSSSTSGVDSGSQVTLSSNKTLYATWAKPVTLRFNANGCATESKTVSQTLYNFNVNSTVTVPSVTMNTNWTSLGVSSSASSTSQGTAIGSSMSYSTQCSNSVHDFYYNCKKDVTVVFNDNKCTTASKNATTTLYNGGTSASVTVPNVTMNSGWTTLGASSSSSSTSSGTAIGSKMSMTVGSSVVTVNRYYNCSKNVSVTFNANGCTTSNQTATMKLYNGGESSSVVVPTATMISNWVNFGASASSSSKSAGTSMGASMTISGVASATTSVTRYYNCGKAARIDIIANGCTTADGIVEFDLYNGATTATVTIPTATMKTNWKSLGASTSASSTSGGTAMGSSTTVTVASASKSTTYYYNCKKDVTVTFNANSCTSASGSVTKTLYNGATSTAVTVPTKDMINTTWKTLGASASASSTSQGTAMGSSMTISSIGSSTTSVNRYYNCYKEVGVNFYSNYCTTDTGWVNSTIYNGATSVTVSMPTDYTAESGRTIKGASTDGSSHSASSTVTVPLGDLRNSIGYAYFICTRNFDIIFKANGCATGDGYV